MLDPCIERAQAGHQTIKLGAQGIGLGGLGATQSSHDPAVDHRRACTQILFFADGFCKRTALRGLTRSSADHRAR